MYTAKAIANYFLKLGFRDKEPIDPLKLQKLIFFAHGWHLAIRERELVNEFAEAWPYGPVFPSIYHEFKEYRREPIDRLALRESDGDLWEPAIRQDDAKTISILSRIWEEYGRLSGKTLSQMTHQEGTPWAETWLGDAQRGRFRGVDISNEKIKQYFREAAEESRRDREAGQAHG